LTVGKKEPFYKCFQAISAVRQINGGTPHGGGSTEGELNMSFLKSKVFIGTICFIAGALSMFEAQKFLIEPRWVQHHQHGLFPGNSLNAMSPFSDDGFFDHSGDPFADMEKMQERMMKQFQDRENSSHSLFGFGHGQDGAVEAGEIKKREDDKFVYYDISIKGLNRQKLKVNVVKFPKVT
jgi:hypothetical protein